MGSTQSITVTKPKQPTHTVEKFKPTTRIVVTTPGPPSPPSPSQPRTTDDPPPAGVPTPPPPLPPPTTKAAPAPSASSSTGSSSPSSPAASANRVVDGSSDSNSPLPGQSTSGVVLSESFPSESFSTVPASPLVPSALASPASATASASISSSTATTSAVASVNPGSKHVPVPAWIVAPILGFAALVAIAGFVAYRSGWRYAASARSQRSFTESELRAGSSGTSTYGSQFNNPGRGPGEFLRVEICTSDPETQSRSAIANEAAALPDYTSLGPFGAPPSPSSPYSPTTIGSAHWQPGDHHPDSSPLMRALTPTSESDTVVPTSRGAPPPYDSSWRLQPPLPNAYSDQKVV